MTDHQLRLAVEAFLYHEAELLDDRRFYDWLDLFTDDARYRMPVRESRLTKPDALGGELLAENCYFDDSKQDLRTRVDRLFTGLAWAESPPSRTRHLISNVRVRSVSAQGIEVASNFLLYRTRLERDCDLFAGERQDLLLPREDSFRIARRTIVLDQAVLDAKNLSVFI